MSFKPVKMPGGISQIDSLSLSSRDLGIIVKAFINKGHSIQFRAKGNSMFPIIMDGDIIRVTPYIDLSPARGDIVAFIDSRSKNLIVHRVLDIHGGIFISKGDNANSHDGKQSTNKILGFITKINNNSFIDYGINYTPIKKLIAFCSKIGVSKILSKCLFCIYIKKAGHKNQRP